MARAARTFRVFVSSTFADLKAERNALQEQVFPRLRQLCLRYGCRFQAIDLRWGVSEEASLDQQTMRICLEELKRCQQVTPRPNFVVLLGDRYGWQPLPAEIPADEYAAIAGRISPLGLRLLRAWYRRDDNAHYERDGHWQPGIWVLERRTGGFVDYKRWRDSVERPLREALREAIRGLDLSEEARLKYQAAATHQEIDHGALRAERADEHVFAFLRHITNLDEVRAALPGKPAEDYVDAIAAQVDEPAQQALRDLQQQLRERLAGRIYEREARWTGRVSEEHIGTLPPTLELCLPLFAPGYAPQCLCEAAFQSLGRTIEAECMQLASRDALELEIKAHDDFGQERVRFLVGQRASLTRIGSYLANKSQSPLVICGVSGSGKSALMACAARQARAVHPKAQIAVRFAGATPEACDERLLLASLCREICHAYGADQSPMAIDHDDLPRAFAGSLALATAQKPLLVFLDALDQIAANDDGADLAWLPLTLPAHVHLIISTTPGRRFTALAEELPASNLIELGPMDHSEGAALLDLWLADAHRGLQASQRADILAKFASCGLPLYLRLAFEEARRWRSDDGLPEGAVGQPGLASDVPGAIRDFFRRLALEANHGEVLVSRSLGYLTASRYGLSEDEMLDILARDQEVMADFWRRSPESPVLKSLPVVVWARLYSDLEHYLAHGGADDVLLLRFFHSQMKEVAAKDYLAGGAGRVRHGSLARYFGDQPLHADRVDGPSPNRRRILEQPWQLAQSEAWQDLGHLLAEPAFFCAAWDNDPYEVKGFWRQVTANSGLTIAAAYAPVFERSEDDPDTLLVLDRLAHLLRDTGDPGGARVCHSRLLGALRHDSLSDAAPIISEQYLAMARLEYECRNFEASARWGKRALAAAQRTRDRDLESRCLMNAGLVAKALGHWPEARLAYEQALELATELRNRALVTRLLINLGNVAKRVQSYVESERRFREALAGALEAKDRESEARCYHGLGDVAVAQGNLAAALSWFERSLDLKKQLGDYSGMAVCYVGLGNVAQSEGRLSEATGFYQKAIEACPHDRLLRATCYYNMASVAARQGNEAEAGDLLRQSSALMQELGIPLSPEMRLAPDR